MRTFLRPRPKDSPGIPRAKRGRAPPNPAEVVEVRRPRESRPYWTPITSEEAANGLAAMGFYRGGGIGWLKRT